MNSPSVDDEDDGGLDSEDDDEAEYLAGTTRPDETCVTIFSADFISALAAVRSSAPARSVHWLIPHRFSFFFGHKTSYSVNTCVDGAVFKKDCRDPAGADDPVAVAGGQIFTGEYKSTRYQPIWNQLAYELAAKISSRYAKGGDNAKFTGRYVCLLPGPFLRVN